MPCWYFEKKEICHSPSLQQGIDATIEARYRREGARLILDAGSKLGLRYDTCATGVVYFHRFYVFHSFKEFHRYVTAACCLFLAGKVEETPKKCKDIIRTCHSLLSPPSFAVFGDNPREEVMTLERILLQTIKFDLQVEHPHSSLLKYAKLIKGDKDKTQKIVQMAWTFVNDSLCTTLCLQWEPEIVAVSMMYLASRLQKYEIADWQGRVPNTNLKWWEFILEDLSMLLMEDVCHQVLDLYSQQSKDASLKDKGESPPPSPPKTVPPPPTGLPTAKRPSVPVSPVDPKKAKREPSQQKKSSSSTKERPPAPPSALKAIPPALPIVTTTAAPTTFNAYMDASASFMSQEGSQAIQPLLSGTPTPTTTHYPPYPQPTSAPPGYTAPAYPPAPAGYLTPTTYAPASNPQYQGLPASTPTYPPHYPPHPPPAGYPPPSSTASGVPVYPPAAPAQAPGYRYPPPPHQYPNQVAQASPHRPAYPPPAGPGHIPPMGYPPGGARFNHPPPQVGAPGGPRPGNSGPKNISMQSSHATIRISGRRPPT